VNLLVAVPTPLSIIADVFRVPDSDFTDAEIDTLLNDISRQRVEGMLPTPLFLLACPLSFLRWSIFTLRTVFDLAEVVNILFDGVSRVE
jgi:hypothetical protein